VPIVESALALGVNRMFLNIAASVGLLFVHGVMREMKSAKNVEGGVLLDVIVRNEKRNIL
jgi:hypothetical protein